MRSLQLALATVLYCGYVPIAPGTAGSIAGLVVFAAVRASGSSGVEVVTLLAVLALGVWAGTAAERHFGRRDPGPIVIDEVAGMLVTLLFISVGWSGTIVGFLAFRVFDILKPFPAGAAERLPGGWGVMADDVVAGVYAHISLRLTVWTGLIG